MLKEKDIIVELNGNYFWDVDNTKIDENTSSQFIIKRVFSLGSIEDMKTVIAYYGLTNVERELQNVHYLDPKTLQFVAVLFNKPKEEFRCFKQMPSTPKCWNS